MGVIGRRGGVLTTAAIVVAIGAAVLAAPASAKKAPKGFFGVVPQGPLGATDYSLMSQADVGSIRFMMNWSQIQRNPGACTAAIGVCDWRAADAVIGNAAARGITPLPFLYGSAGFVSSNERKPPLSKAGLAGWQQFASAAVARYGPGGAYWRGTFQAQHPGASPRPLKAIQVWNEPSSKAFFAPKPKAKKYVKLLKASARGIRGANKKVDIVLGGIFGDPAGANIPPTKYLGQLYRVKKADKYFDAVALHPYSRNTKGLKVIGQQIGQTRKAMKKGGDKKAKLWITEFGWASGGPKRLGNVTNKKGQAKMLKQSFAMMAKKRKKWRLAGATWFAWQDSNSAGVCRFCRKSGLVTTGLKPKPSYNAFRKAAR